LTFARSLTISSFVLTFAVSNSKGFFSEAMRLLTIADTSIELVVVAAAVADDEEVVDAISRFQEE
jgi:hypothetical protein